MEVIKERKQLREKVIKEAREWASKLPFKSTVVLIGSYARGDFNLWSDVDIVIIAEMRGNPLERLKAIDQPPGYEVIPLTPKEFMRKLREGDPIAKEVVTVGIVLRDDLRIKELIHQ